MVKFIQFPKQIYLLKMTHILNPIYFQEKSFRNRKIFPPRQVKKSITRRDLINVRLGLSKFLVERFESLGKETLLLVNRQGARIHPEWDQNAERWKIILKRILAPKSDLLQGSHNVC